MNKIKGIIRIFRLELSLAAGICTIAGQILALGKIPHWQPALLAFICSFCLSSAAVILNDYFDYEVDLVNMPHRPLPSGLVTRADVVGLTVLTTLAGLAAAAFLGWIALVFSFIIWLVGFLYNWRYKQTGLPGNLMVSTSVAFTFILGAISVGEPRSMLVWIFAMLAFFVDLGEEIAGDAMDMEGDSIRGSQSIALLSGKPFALRLAVALWGMVILIGFLPFVLGLLSPIYLVIFLAADVMIIHYSIRLLKSDDAIKGRQAMRGVYLGMTVFIVVILIAQFIG